MKGNFLPAVEIKLNPHNVVGQHTTYYYTATPKDQLPQNLIFHVMHDSKLTIYV